MSQLGTTLLIANPQARSGKALKVAEHLHTSLTRKLSQAGGSSPALVFTQKPGDAKEIAHEQGPAYDTVVTLGGDGVVHETVNGLMALPRDSRPQLGVIPYGNGDDFARSLGMDRDPDKAMDQIVCGTSKPLDIGCVNGEWFDESLSLGFDAAIALDTMELRRQTNRTGTVLYLQSAWDNLLHQFVSHKLSVSFDGHEPQTFDAYLIAIQNGAYYGGGFKITPDSKLDDGLFDVCIATGPFTKAKAALLFARAKGGKHVNARGLQFKQCRKLTICTHSAVPCQVDGEPLPAETYEVSMERGGLHVIVPR